MPPSPMLCALVSALVSAAISAQELPTAHVAFAADQQNYGPPAIVWLRHELLAPRSEWPKGQRAEDAFALHVSQGYLRIAPSLALPAGVAATGEGTLPDGIQWSFCCTVDGHDELVLRGGKIPSSLVQMLEALHVNVGGAPRRINLPALTGHLTGATLEGDAERALLPLAAMQCGDVTFSVTQRNGEFVVCGGSDGGLFLPALVLWLAASGASALKTPDAATSFSLRAFSGLDGDRAEAARQLQRAGGTAIHGLRALLHGEEDCQLAAIDGLIRLGATAELPRIVAAAASARPLVTNAAANAVHELYPHATALSRQATRAALAASTVLSLDILPIEVANDSAANLRMRGLMLLTIITAVVFGCWQRERSLLRLSSVPIT